MLLQLRKPLLSRFLPVITLKIILLSYLNKFQFRGDSLREVSLSPQNSDKDFIYVCNGNYVDNVSFTGTLDEGEAIIALNPDKPSFVTQGPYIRTVQTSSQIVLV